MRNPLVSIIVPVYNTAEYIDECVQSILSQSYTKTEIILINDGSTDGSGEICQKYVNLPHVRYVEQENRGLTKVREKGVMLSRGEWVMFVDSDDMLLQDSVKRLVQLSEKDCDIVIGRRLDNNNADLPDYYSWEEYLYRIYSITTSVSTWGKLYRKQLVKNSPHAFEYNLIRAEDLLTNIAIAKTNRKKVHICKEPVYYYRQRADSLVHTVPYTFDYCYKLCDIADSIMGEALTYNKRLNGSIEQRLHYYFTILQDHNYQGNKKHPFVKDIIRRMNEVRVLRLSDRLVLAVSDRKTVKICLLSSKIIRRLEKPSLILKDIKRIIKR